MKTWGIYCLLDFDLAIVLRLPDQLGQSFCNVTARLNGKYGAIDYQQRTIIDFTWAHLEIVDDNFAAGKTVKHFTEGFQKIIFGIISGI